MKELPYLEEIYDWEAEQLEDVLSELNISLQQISDGIQFELPKGIDSYDKFERKIIKLKDAIELELHERKQVDDVINFFLQDQPNEQNNKINDILNDDKFYKPPEPKFLKSTQDQITSEGSEIFQSGYADQKTETTSVFEEGDVGHKMFQDRKLKSKKDMQQFMKEKLQKTKISSETMSHVLATGTNTKNFTKKGKQDNQSDFQSGKSNKPINNNNNKSTKNNQKSDIYKPNFNKKPTNKIKDQQRSLSRKNSIEER